MRGNNFLIPGTYSLAGGTNTCGAMTQWYRDILFSDYLQEEQQGGKTHLQGCRRNRKSPQEARA